MCLKLSGNFCAVGVCEQFLKRRNSLSDDYEEYGDEITLESKSRRVSPH